MEYVVTIMRNQEAQPRSKYWLSSYKFEATDMEEVQKTIQIKTAFKGDLTNTVAHKGHIGIFFLMNVNQVFEWWKPADHAL